MGTKNNPGKFDCYASLDPDEPYFILTARDAMAASLVRSWAQMRHQQIEMGGKPIEDMEKVVEARQCANAMERWRADKLNAELARVNAVPPHVPAKNPPVAGPAVEPGPVTPPEVADGGEPAPAAPASEPPTPTVSG